MNPLALLRDTADPRWLAVDGEAPLLVVARMALPDGTPWVIRLEIRVTPGSVMPEVWEVGTTLIPRCPARHLYTNGSFCMGYGESGPPPVFDANLACQWWAVLRGYLELQIIATLTAEWPPQHARPHGVRAAAIDDLLTCFGLVLDPALVAAVQAGAVRLGDREDRLEARRRPCPCGRGTVVKDCHEEVLVALLHLRKEQGEEEKRFWAARADTPCCGTMKDCPLRRGVEGDVLP